MSDFCEMSLGKPPRLDRIFQICDPPLFFVTLCTLGRRNILANEAAHRTVMECGRRVEEKAIALGRYVIMPDHLHLFVSGDLAFNLGIWSAV